MYSQKETPLYQEFIDYTMCIYLISYYIHTYILYNTSESEYVYISMWLHGRLVESARHQVLRHEFSV